MIDTTKKYRTKSGLKARILAVDIKHPRYPVVAAVQKPHGQEAIYSYTSDLRFNENGADDYDLVEYREPKVIWVNEYGNNEEYAAHPTKESAIDAAHSMVVRVAVKYIEATDEESTPK